MRKEIYLIMVAIFSISTLISCKDDIDNDQTQPTIEFTLDNSMRILRDYVVKDIDSVQADLTDKGFIVTLNDGENLEATKNNMFKVSGKAFQTGLMQWLSLDIDELYLKNTYKTKEGLFEKFISLINLTKQMDMNFYYGTIQIRVKENNGVPEHSEYIELLNEQTFMNYYYNEEVEAMQVFLRNSEKEVYIRTNFSYDINPDCLFYLHISAYLIGTF